MTLRLYGIRLFDYWSRLAGAKHDEPECLHPHGRSTGRRVVPYGLRDHMLRTIPRLAEQLTGQPYRGVIQHGLDDRMLQPGWITIRFVTYEEEPERSEGACGIATVGADRGAIWIIRRARGDRNCVDDQFFPRILRARVRTCSWVSGMWRTRRR